MGNRVALANHLGPMLSNDVARVESVVAMVETAGATRERTGSRRPPAPADDDFRRFISEFRLRRLTQTSDR